MASQHGVVKFFNNVKGFGFIDIGQGKPNVFVHHTGIQMEGFRTLNEGDEVEFDVETTPKGLQAIGVVVVNPARKKE